MCRGDIDGLCDRLIGAIPAQRIPAGRARFGAGRGHGGAGDFAPAGRRAAGPRAHRRHPLGPCNNNCSTISFWSGRLRVAHTSVHCLNTIIHAQATAYLVRRSVELPPSAREAIYETALRLEEWGAALRQFPSLLENPAVRRVFSLQVRSRRVLALPLRRPPYKPNHDAHTTHTAVPPLRHLGRRGPRQSREPPTGGPGPRRGPDPRLRHPLPPRVGKHAHTRGLDGLLYVGAGHSQRKMTHSDFHFNLFILHAGSGPTRLRKSSA